MMKAMDDIQRIKVLNNCLPLEQAITI